MISPGIGILRLLNDLKRVNFDVRTSVSVRYVSIWQLSAAKIGELSAQYSRTLMILLVFKGYACCL